MLLASIWGAQTVVVRHLADARGLDEEFPPVVAGADAPLLGVNVALEQYSPEQLEAILDDLTEAGFVWLRQPFYWRQLAPTPGRADWDAADRIVKRGEHGHAGGHWRRCCGAPIRRAANRGGLAGPTRYNALNRRTRGKYSGPDRPEGARPTVFLGSMSICGIHR